MTDYNRPGETFEAEHPNDELLVGRQDEAADTEREGVSSDEEHDETRVDDRNVLSDDERDDALGDEERGTALGDEERGNTFGNEERGSALDDEHGDVLGEGRDEGRGDVLADDERDNVLADEERGGSALGDDGRGDVLGVDEPAQGAESFQKSDAAQPDVAADQQSRPGEHRANPTIEGFEPVFSTEHGDEVQQRWRDIQASFVDDPQDAIARAGKLTDEVLSTLSTGLENRRRTLERDVTEGDTEQLRLAIRQYRLMLDHVLAL